MKHFLIGFLFVLPFAVGAELNEIDNSRCDGPNICIGHYVTAKNTNWEIYDGYEGYVRGFENGKFCLHNGASDGVKCQIWAEQKDVFKEVPCKDFVCSNTMAYSLEDRAVYRIAHIFTNSQVYGHKGNPNAQTSLQSNLLFTECKCVGEICKGTVIKTPKNLTVKVERVFPNGIVSEFIYDGQFRNFYKFEELGIKGSSCTEETPCSCDQ